MAIDPNTTMACDPTTLFYAYSTTAQVLAAAFAFVGVFLLFRVEGINKACEKISDFLYERHKNGGYKIAEQHYFAAEWLKFAEAFIAIYKEKKWNEAEQLAKENLCKKKTKKEIDSEVDTELKNWRPISPVQIKELSQTLDEIITKFKKLSYILIALIIISLICLSISGLLCQNCGSFWIPLIIITIGSAGCLYGCINFIVTSLPVYKTNSEQLKLHQNIFNFLKGLIKTQK
ncbi:MAG: hypothetical protein A2178_00085 [Planctomycetes bacterium GWC2_49_10]|nr:MAG: hypothetical protein A2178_00085 [Planctomycetes bacterium GWC2_49_10]